MVSQNIMDEIEIKILEIDKDRIIKRIKSLGGRLIEEGVMRSFIFDTEKKELKHSGKLLRLRDLNNKKTITYKKAKEQGTIKVRKEIETEIADIQNMKDILEGIGMVQVAEDLRYRTSFKLKDSRIEIDEYKDIPVYLEIESPDKQELQEIVRMLGYSMKDTTSETYNEVRKRYGS